MPLKLGLSEAEALAFLRQRFDPTSDGIVKLGQGCKSDAYRFRHHPEEGGRERILRIGLMRDGYRKELRVLLLCESGVPIPRILQTGELPFDGVPAHYAVSERADGELLGETIEADLVPEYLRVLDRIHAADVSATSGFGKIDGDGRGSHATWEQFLLAGKQRDWTDVCERTFLERDLCEWMTGQIEALVAALPPVRERRLYHGDPHSYNMLKRDGRIIAVIDWEDAGVGDPLYDHAVADVWDDIEEPGQRYRAQAMRHFMAQGRVPPHVEERLRLYGLVYGLEVLEVYARGGRRDKYDAFKVRLADKGILPDEAITARSAS